MKTPVTFLNSFLLLLLVVLFTACHTESKFVNSLEMDTSKIPADFNPDKHILLVAEMPRLNKPSERNAVVTRKLNEALKESYPYKYEIVSVQEIGAQSLKYSDTSIYKYALLNTLNSVVHGHTSKVITKSSHGTTSTSVSPSARTTFIDFSFYDRTLKKQFPPTGSSSTRISYSVAALAGLIQKAKKG